MAAICNRLRKLHLTNPSSPDSFTRTFDYGTTNNQLTGITVATSIGTYTYDYDEVGNQIKENTTRNYEWDHSNNMRSFFNQAGTSEPTIYAQYLYSGSQRVKKLVRTSAGGYESTSYVGGIYEYKTDGTEEQNMLHVQSIARIRTGDAMEDSSPAIKYNLEDNLGSSMTLLDETGDWVNREEYYPFGETSFGSYELKRYRFQGKEKDTESGLYYFGARYYCASNCRFISVDVVVQPSQSSYIGMRNNPIIMTDPDGNMATVDPPVRTAASMLNSVKTSNSNTGAGGGSRGASTYAGSTGAGSNSNTSGGVTLGGSTNNSSTANSSNNSNILTGCTTCDLGYNSEKTDNVTVTTPVNQTVGQLTNTVGSSTENSSYTVTTTQNLAADFSTKTANVGPEGDCKLGGLGLYVNDAVYSSFTNYLAKKFIDHYENGKGETMYLSDQEMEDTHVAKTGLEGIDPDDIAKFDDFLSTMNVGETAYIAREIMGMANTGGTLGRFTIQFEGFVTKTGQTDYTFEGQMRFYDIWDFRNDGNDNSGNIVRSDWGDDQTWVGYNCMCGTPFKVYSNWVEVTGDSDQSYVSYFAGRSDKVIANPLQKIYRWFKPAK